MSQLTEKFRTYLEAERRASPHTITAYMRDVEAFMAYCEDADPSTVTWREVRGWVMTLTEKGQNPSSTNRAIASVRSFFHFLLRKGVCTEDPTERFTSLRTKSALPNFIHESDIAKVLEPVAPPDDPYNALLERAVIETLYTTGLRRSELLSLTRASLDLESQVLRLVGKGNKEREIPLTDSLTATLKALIAAQDQIIAPLTATDERSQNGKIWKNNSFFLFLCKSSKPLSQSQLYDMVRRILRLAGIQGKCSPHVLRHTFATHLMGENVGLRAIQELMGHSRLSTTQKYTHTSIQQLKKSYNNAHPRALLEKKSREKN